MTDKYAVIGCGPWGKNHLRIAGSLLGKENVTACDTDSKILKKAASDGFDAMPDYHTVLECRDISAISVCTPASSHYKIVKEALNAGKHVLVEKPFTLKSLEAKELVKLANKQKVVLAVGQVFRFDPAIKRLKEEIKKGVFGGIYYMSLSRLGLKTPREDVGAIFNYAIHDLDIMCDVLGQSLPDEITAVATHSLKRKFEDHAVVLARFKNGTVGYSQVGWLSPKKLREFWLVGEKRSACVNTMSPELEIFESGIVPEYKDLKAFELITKEGPSYKLPFENIEPLQEEIKHFLDCINLGIKPVNSGDVGLNTVKMAEAALNSAKHARAIKIFD